MFSPKSPFFSTVFNEPLGSLEQYLLVRRVDIEKWFRAEWQKTPPPLYGSVDLRNSGFKLAPVDTNLFPAGFNNLNPKYTPLYVQAMQSAISRACPQASRLLLIPESHSRNTFYFENLATIAEILSQAGFWIRIGSLDESLEESLTLSLPSGRQIILEPIIREGNRVGVANFMPCCIILNNDLSSGIPELLKNLDQIILPSLYLGWFNRLKSKHFQYYNRVTQEFSELLEIDPWLITPFFDHCPEINFSPNADQTCLIKRSQALIQKIKEKFQKYSVKIPPFLVIKANAGTYGMAVMMIKKVEELMHLNRKQRSRMSTTKGGIPVNNAIIQEGVYTFETENSSVAEPVIYLIGECAVGGFYRVHKDRGVDENLNAPGMDFVPLPFSQACNSPSIDSDIQTSKFYIYGVIARLAFLSAARELAFLNGERQ